MRIIKIEWLAHAGINRKMAWYTVWIQAENKEEATALRKIFTWHGAWLFRPNFMALDELDAMKRVMDFLANAGHVL